MTEMFLVSFKFTTLRVEDRKHECIPLQWLYLLHSCPVATPLPYMASTTHAPTTHASCYTCIPTDRITDKCKNITLPQLRLQAVTKEERSYTFDADFHDLFFSECQDTKLCNPVRPKYCHNLNWPERILAKSSVQKKEESRKNQSRKQIK